MVLFRVLLGIFFAFSGYSKLTHPVQNFAAVIESYELVRGSGALLLAQTLPWLELIGGLFLAIGLWLRLSLLAVSAMNLMFIGVLAQAILRKLPINDCGCFGGAIHLKPWQTLLMDIGVMFILLLMTRFLQNTKKWSLDKYFDRA